MNLKPAIRMSDGGRYYLEPPRFDYNKSFDSRNETQRNVSARTLESKIWNPATNTINGSKGRGNHK